MANELRIPDAPTGKVITAQVYSPLGVALGSPLTLTETAGVCVADFPSSITTAGEYIVEYTSNGNPIGGEVIKWTGTAMDTGGNTTYITPVSVTVSTSGVAEITLKTYQNASIPWQMGIVDDLGVPVDLSGKNLRFVATHKGTPTVAVITRTTGDNDGVTISGPDHNQVIITLDKRHTKIVQVMEWALWDGETPLAKGLLLIDPISQ